MSNSALNEFLQKKPQGSVAEKISKENAAETAELEQDEIDYRAFGVNRGRRQAIMLDIRTLEGLRLAMPYSYLTSIFFDMSGKIVLSFGSHNISIQGRNLAPLYEKLLSHCVRYIQQENPKLEADSPADDTFISVIDVNET